MTDNHDKPTPVYRPGLRYIGDCPAGAQMMSLDDMVILVAPGIAPQYITPIGLVPVEMHPKT